MRLWDAWSRISGPNGCLANALNTKLASPSMLVAQHRRVSNSKLSGFCRRSQAGETGIRHEADHPSASPRDGLLPHALKLHLHFWMRWMGSGEVVLFALAFGNVRRHIFSAPHIEGDRPINLLEAQYRIMRPNGLRGLPALKFSHDVGEGHTTSDQIEATDPSFNEFLAHESEFSLYDSRRTAPQSGLYDAIVRAASAVSRQSIFFRPMKPFPTLIPAGHSPPGNCRSGAASS